MSMIIGFGKYNHYYKYIFLSSLFLFLNLMAFGINYNDSFVEIKLFPGNNIENNAKEQNKIKEGNNADDKTVNNTFINETLYYEVLGTINNDYNIDDSSNNCNNKEYSPEQRQPYFSKHKYIHQMFCYLITFLFGIIYYFIEMNKTQWNSILSNKKQEKRAKPHSSIKLLHKDIGKLNFSTYSYLNLLFTCFLWVIMDFFMDFYTHTLKDLDFWFFELLILSFISNKMLKYKLYSHQKLAIYFNSDLCITKMIVIILSFCDENSNRYLWYTEDPFLKVFFGIIIYFVLISIRSYVNTKIKVYMDLKYISAKKLLILYGFCGTIIYTIICLITTSVECTTSSIFSYNANCSISNSSLTNNNCSQNYNKNFAKNFVCKVPFNNTIVFGDSQIIFSKNENIYYFDNFDIYFKTFKNSDALEILKEIIIILFAGTTYFYYKYFCLMIIKFLSPIHYIFSNEIYFSFKKIALPIYTLFNEKSFFIKESIKYIIPKYILDTSGDFLSLIGFLVFLELIELNFCDFNINLRRKIMDRSEFESISLLNDYFDDDDNDDNNDNNINNDDNNDNKEEEEEEDKGKNIN